ncbi:MAG TPA: DUF4178 domain-containing protein [Thermoanaerobaculia bacterium]|nr:DUF4178 domain-containing protein [Thermoanaerobaculia bacterium]
MTRANCPSCGGPIEFAIGSSAVVVCGYCRSVVARTDRGPEAHGVVAALVDTGSPLRVGATGRHQNNGFRITGRTQMRHQAGGVWDEWYAYFDDGRWGWLAEAQGRYYVTFPVAGAKAPAREELQLGGRVWDLVVSEIGTAEVISAEGELPWRPTPNETYDYADLTGAKLEFATIDYSEETSLFFLGQETSLDKLGLDDQSARGTRTSLTALRCSNCGGPLELVAPDRAERVFCPNCGTAHDVGEGKFAPLKQLKRGKKVNPVIPLGTTGTIDGVAYVVAGFMQRSVKFDKTYYWTEYLLFNREQGFRWLVHSDDHWSFVTPLRAGEVADWSPAGASPTVVYGGKSYRLFQTATARVTYVIGEFYWRVEVGEEVDTADYIAPPLGISKEVTRGGAEEINYSHARYLQPEEVEAAFGVKNLTRPPGAGPMQPYPGPRLLGAWLVMTALLFITAIAIGVSKPRRQVMNQTYNLAEVPEGGAAGFSPPEQNGGLKPAAPSTRVLFTEPFELSGTQNVMVRGAADLQNTWLYVTADLVNDANGKMQTFDLPLEYYSGVDQGERWSEGSSNRREYLSAPEKGRYVLRLETQWQDGQPAPALHVVVTEGIFRWPYFILALIAVGVLPLLGVIRQFAFEQQRWADSAYSPFGQSSDSEEEDDE